MRYFFSIFISLWIWFSCRSSQPYHIIASMHPEPPLWYHFNNVWSTDHEIFFKIETNISQINYPISSCIDLSYKKAKYNSLKEIHAFLKNYPQYENIYQDDDGRAFLAFLTEGEISDYEIKDQYWEIIEEHKSIYRKCYALISLKKESFLAQAELNFSKVSQYHNMIHSFFYYTKIIEEKEHPYFYASRDLNLENPLKKTSVFIETPKKQVFLGRLSFDNELEKKQIIEKIKLFIKDNHYINCFIESYTYDASFLKSYELSKKQGLLFSKFLKDEDIPISQEYFLGKKYPLFNYAYRNDSNRIIIKLDTLPQIRKIYSVSEIKSFETHKE